MTCLHPCILSWRRGHARHALVKIKNDGDVDRAARQDLDIKGILCFSSVV